MTSVSDESRNVHWFSAQKTPALMFNVQVTRVDAGLPSGGRDYIDPLRAVDAGGGLLRARRLDRHTAYALYARS